VVKLLSARRISDPEHGVYSHRFGRFWLAGGASNSGGAVLKALFDDDEIRDFTARLEPERPTGLDYYPLLRPGERFPLNDADLAPRLLPRPTERRRFFQAVLEGIAGIERRGYGLLRELGAPPLRRVATLGGGASNCGWRSIRQNLLRVPVVAARHPDAAYGAALLARNGEI